MSMALPTSIASDWSGTMDFPSRLFGTRGTDFELYEQDDAFVLTIELPGYEREDISVNWYEGRLSVSAEHEDEARGRRRTYHRTFRVPKEIEPEEVDATYRNGVLEVTLPILEGATHRGQAIEVTG